MATFALDYVGSPALHCVTLVMKNSCFTKNTKQRMLSKKNKTLVCDVWIPKYHFSLHCRRFIFLQDCKHCIEVETMDSFMNEETKIEGCMVIGYKSCPRCKTVIRQGKRYGNILRLQKQDTMKVKEKVMHGVKNMRHLQVQKFNKLDDRDTKKRWMTRFPNLWEYIVKQLVDIVAVKHKKHKIEVVPTEVNIFWFLITTNIYLFTI